MLKEQYKELEELRTYLNVKSKQKLANNLRIRELRGQLLTTRSELQEELNNKRHYMEIDKELRSLHEITNQKDWTAKVKELTREAEEELEHEIGLLEDAVDELSYENDIIRIRVEDTRWELTLKNGYYQDHPELVNVTPVKEAV